MELRDLIVTPILIVVVFLGGYFIRPFVTDPITRRYFFPALTVRILGALSLGLIYQFYYSGGDTFMYHTHGSRLLWNAFMDDALIGFKLLVADGDLGTGMYKYASNVYFFRDPASYMVIRIATVCDLITFSSYSGTAVLFAVLSFIGSWLLFQVLYSYFPHLHQRLAIAVFFIPSVFFWGSGLLKDTITLACLGAAVYAINFLLIRRQFRVSIVIMLGISFYLLYVIKVYILLCLLPAAIIWLVLHYFSLIQPAWFRRMLFPVALSASVALGYYAIVEAAEDNERYAFDKIAKTAQVTAYDIRYWTGRDAGSGYSLGELDGTWQSLFRLAPEAINASLFRPYLWEVKNVLMLLTSVESFVLLGLTIYVIVRCRTRLFKYLAHPTILFCFIFSLTFAFAVGVSTFNFGTLARYKIPLLPFYSCGLILMLEFVNRERNTGENAVLE